MKARFLMMAVGVAMMAFTACTNEKIVYVESDNGTEQLKPGEGIIEIALSSATTRAARPIDHFNPTVATTDGGNNVNCIGFRVYDNEGVLDDNVKVTAVDNSDVTETTLNEYVLQKSLSSYASNQTIKIKLSGLSQGINRIIAYGYNAANGTTFPYTLTNQQKTVDDESGEPTMVDIVGLKCAINTTDSPEKFPEEIFSGAIEANVNAHGLFTAENTLILERQVAGMLVYLKNVPSYVLNKKVGKITISTIIDVEGLYFPYKGENDELNPAYNGYGKTSSFSNTDLLTFTFNAENTSNFDTASNGGSYNFSRESNGEQETDNKRFLLPDEMDVDVKQYMDDNIECKSNTLFGSCFLLPFPAENTSHDGWNALNIVYWGTDGQMIKAVPLKDSNVGNGDGYSITRNHFYSIGTKRTSDVPDPDDEEDPDDDPLDINDVTGYDYYYLQIDDTWDGYFGLGRS